MVASIHMANGGQRMDLGSEHQSLGLSYKVNV